MTFVVSKEKILANFIQWFLSLNKSQRRELMSVLGDENEAYDLRAKMYYEAEKAFDEYEEVVNRVN